MTGKQMWVTWSAVGSLTPTPGPKLRGVVIHAECICTAAQEGR